MIDSDSSPTAQAPANKGVKQGLPATGLKAAEDAAAKLWEVARLGVASPEAFARQFGEKAKASGGAWDTRLAVLRGFKLVRFEGKQIGLSELGQRLVNTSDPSGQTAARRSALVSLKAYRELVDSFDGTPLPDVNVLATKLQFEYGKKEDFANRAARAFVDSLKHAEMLDHGDVVRKAGVSQAAPDPTTTGVVDPPDADDEDAQAAAIDDAFDEGETEAPGGQSDAGASEAQRAAGSTPNVSLALTLDLSQFRADEVVQILAALGLGRRG